MVSCQAPLSVGFFRQECWEWVAVSFFRSSSQPRDRTCVFLQWQADSLPLSHQGSPVLALEQPRPVCACQGSLLCPQGPGVWCFSTPSLAFPVPVAVLAPVSWAAARTSQPGPLTPVSLPAPRLMRLSAERDTVRLDSLESLGNRAVKTKRLARVLSHFSFSPLARVSGHL